MKKCAYSEWLSVELQAAHQVYQSAIDNLGSEDPQAVYLQGRLDAFDVCCMELGASCFDCPSQVPVTDHHCLGDECLYYQNSVELHDLLDKLDHEAAVTARFSLFYKVALMFCSAVILLAVCFEIWRWLA